MPADPPARRNALLPPELEMASEPEMAPEFRLQVEFRVLQITLGDKEARRLLKKVTKRKRGRPSGSTKPEQDQVMLRLYDYCARNPREPSEEPSLWIGKKLDEVLPLEYGPNAKAITTRLRRLLTARAKAAERSKMREEAAARPSSGNLLLDAVRKNK
jgi:hypothetical protein